MGERRYYNVVRKWLENEGYYCGGFIENSKGKLIYFQDEGTARLRVDVAAVKSMGSRVEDEGKIDKIVDSLRERYTRTLRDRPWEKCDCPVCKENGIDVINFREGWRNGARSSHDVRWFYLELNRIRKSIS